MGGLVTLFIPQKRAPFTKPLPGLGIDPRSKFSKGLVHSYPFNEGKSIYCKNYAQPSGRYDLMFRVPTSSDAPQWGTWEKVPGLKMDIDQTIPLTNATNTGLSGAFGFRNLPCVDYSRGFTAHLWMRPTESLVGVVTAYSLLHVGSLDDGSNLVFHIYLSRFAFGGTDYWRRNVDVYSDGSSNTHLTNSEFAWEAPFTGGRVKIDNLPHQHVISVTDRGPNGSIRWYSDDGNDFPFGPVSTVITPPDNQQYWPNFSPSSGGFGVFEGHLWAINIWNYPMSRESAFALMRSPLQMYKSRTTGGGLVVPVPPEQPPYPPPGPYPPGDVPPGDDGDDEEASFSCVDVV